MYACAGLCFDFEPAEHLKLWDRCTERRWSVRVYS